MIFRAASQNSEEVTQLYRTEKQRKQKKSNSKEEANTHHSLSFHRK
jgi:hypothetical protein